MGKWERRTLWACVAILLLFDIALVVGLRLAADKAIVEARAALDAVAARPVHLDIQLDTDVPISATIPLHRRFTVPIETTYHLDTVVQTTVQIPIIGAQEIDIPVAGDIPIRLDVDVPVDTALPVAFTYHLQTTVPVEVLIPQQALEPLYAMLSKVEALLRLRR